MKKRSYLRIKISSFNIMLFLYINLSLVQIITARIGRLTSQPIFISNILSQMVLGTFIAIYFKNRKSVRLISILIPLLTILLFIVSAMIYPNRAEMILSVENGIGAVLALNGSLFGFFIVANISDYMKLEKVMITSLWYLLPYYSYICYRAGKRGYWLIRVGKNIIESSYNMEVGYGVSLLAIMMLYLFYKNRNIIFLFVCGILEFMIVLFGSRGAVLPPVLYLLAWLLVSDKAKMISKGLKRPGIFLICIVCLILLIYNIDTIILAISDFFKSINYYSRTLTRYLTGDVGNASSRIDLWKPLVKKFRSNGYFPLGLYADREYVGTYSHNMFVEILSNFGGIGIIFLGIIAYWTIKFLICCKDEQEKMFLLIFLVFSVTRLMFSSSFWMERYFWIYLALLFVGIRNLKKETYKLRNDVVVKYLRGTT